jgi:hypothetical protein
MVWCEVVHGYKPQISECRPDVGTSVSRKGNFEGVKVMSEDRKQLQVVVPRANGVSTALWPASARHCVATSKEAQRRRYMIINGKKSVLLVPSLSILLVIVTTMVMSAAIVAALSWHLWYLLLVPLLLLPVLLNAHARTDARSMLSNLRRQGRALHTTSRMPLKRTASAKSAQHLQGQATPRTPMPELPLVRVLETVDLSQSDVEHFIDPEDEESDQRRQDTAELLLNLEVNLAPTKNAG